MIIRICQAPLESVNNIKLRAITWLYCKELPFLRTHLIRSIFGKVARQVRRSRLPVLLPLVAIVYDISRFTENPHCSPLKELYGGFVSLISPVVDALNLEERPSKISMTTHGSARKRFGL